MKSTESEIHQKASINKFQKSDFNYVKDAFKLLKNGVRIEYKFVYL